MENIPSSFMGYNKEVVKEIIKSKDNKLKTQQQDINYLRGQIDSLQTQINSKKTK